MFVNDCVLSVIFPVRLIRFPFIVNGPATVGVKVIPLNCVPAT